MNEKGFLEASNCSRDKLWSGSRQTAVLFNTSCCLVDVTRKCWQSVLWLWSPGEVESFLMSTPEKFYYYNSYWHPFPSACSCC